MCELFAMSSNAAASVKYSLEEFSKHGGLTAGNKDGWGISYYEGGEARLIKEAAPAASSPWVSFVAEQYLRSDCVMAHVRLASRGAVRLENTHPFDRELGGRRHVFAHNGSLDGFCDGLPLKQELYRPIGDTDSEHAFCVLLERLHDAWWKNGMPSLGERMEIVSGFAMDARRLGQANFLYYDGDVLFVHAHKRRWEENGECSEPRAPGLHVRTIERYLSGQGVDVGGPQVDCPDQEVLLFASVPLSRGDWDPIEEGTLLGVKAGREVARITP
jgi:glutamine amidotransferase